MGYRGEERMERNRKRRGRGDIIPMSIAPTPRYLDFVSHSFKALSLEVLVPNRIGITTHQLIAPPMNNTDAVARPTLETS